MAKIEDGSHYLDRTTDDRRRSASYGIWSLGVYSVREQFHFGQPHFGSQESTTLRCSLGEHSTITLTNENRPNL